MDMRAKVIGVIAVASLLRPMAAMALCGSGTGCPTCGNLAYGGGTVIQHPKVYISYWNLPTPSDPNGLFPIINGYFGGVNGTLGIGGTMVFETLTQYSAGTPYTIFNDVGILKGNTYNDTTPFMSNPP